MVQDEFVTIDGQRVHWLKAVRLMREAAQEARGKGKARDAVEFLMFAVRILQERNYNDQVVEYLSMVEEIWRETHDLSQLAECLGAKAHFLETDRKFEAALQVLQEVEALDRELGSDQLELTIEQQFGIYYELGNVEEMKRVADEFFRIAKDAEAIWRIRRRLEHHGITAGEDAAAAHSYDMGEKLKDRIHELDQRRISEQRTLYTNSLGMKFVPVPETGVLFSIWETRVRDYATFTRATNRPWKKPPFPQTELHPAVNVDWEDAVAFCEWLTAQERDGGMIGPLQRYRLPTDEEWSRAVGLPKEEGATPAERDGKCEDRFPWDQGKGTWPPPRGAGNYSQKLKIDDFEFTSPVGSFAANAYELFDMGGNVWEWCEDWYDESMRVSRGACWGCLPPVLLISSRRYNGPSRHGDTGKGFRAVLAGNFSPVQKSDSDAGD